jgi:UDP-N-acetylmuramoylalanine--D-glutamate ligase
MRLSELGGRRILIFGTGREASAAADSLIDIASSIVAVDEKDGESAAAWRGKWGARIPLLIAPETNELTGFDVVLKSPGVSPLNSRVVILKAEGVPFTSGTDLWMSDNRAATTAVTGSKGKSTTASLIHHLTVALGAQNTKTPALLGGNIGIPLLSLGQADRYVVELSSHQTESLTTSPDIAVLTSLFPEHLDWHGSEDQYYRDKLNIIANRPRVVIVNGEDDRLLRALEWLHPSVGVQKVGDGELWHLDGNWIARGDEHIINRSELALLGRHNVINCCLALAAVEAAGIPIAVEVARNALAEFRPLEHRLEQIRDASGLIFINDSLSTSPYAAIAALEALDSPDTTLLVGGLDRGVDYSPLAEYLTEHPIAGLVGLPPSGAHILDVLKSAGIRSELAEDMDAAVALARQLTPAGGYVALSPAAPSYGIYRDFADRAADFRRAIADSADGAE